MKKPPEYDAKRNVNISTVNFESDRCRYPVKKLCPPEYTLCCLQTVYHAKINTTIYCIFTFRG